MRWPFRGRKLFSFAANLSKWKVCNVLADPWAATMDVTVSSESNLSNATISSPGRLCCAKHHQSGLPGATVEVREVICLRLTSAGGLARSVVQPPPPGSDSLFSPACCLALQLAEKTNSLCWLPKPCDGDQKAADARRSHRQTGFKTTRGFYGA